MPVGGQPSPSAMFGPYGRIQQTTPPLKGSFPLDYEKECHLQMLKYMACLNKEKSQNGPCRIFARDYFKCRIDKGLMDAEEWERLGYADIEDKNNLNNSEQINIKNQNKK
uniref:Cytochrome c oxidase assembly protein COX19 n=1 Tax=Meloidogyne incognita TaxID=6306 RepID=A0A914M7T9_MELIC